MFKISFNINIDSSMNIQKICPIFFLSAFFLSTLCGQAQTRNTFVNKNVDKAESLINRIARSKYDSTYVALPAHKWMTFVSGNGNYSKYHLRVPMPGIASEWGDMAEEYPTLGNMDVYTYDMNLHSGTQSMSVGVAYRTLRLKYSFNISKGNDRQISFESLGSRFGFMLDYRQTKKMKGDMYDVVKGFETLFEDFDQPVGDIIKAGTSPIDEKYNNYTLLHLQGHYIFNYRHFSYSAGRSGARIQKKSAGSPIALIDFYQSRAKFEQFIIGENERYKTWKLAIGGGYGYNWTPNAGKVLVHASVIPSVNLIRHSSYSTTIPNFDSLTEERKELDEGTISQVKDMVDETPKVTLNCTARMSATWNINSHYVLGAYGSYQYSKFCNKQDYSIREHFYSGSLWLGYRF